MDFMLIENQLKMFNSRETFLRLQGRSRFLFLIFRLFITAKSCFVCIHIVFGGGGSGGRGQDSFA